MDIIASDAQEHQIGSYGKEKNLRFIVYHIRHEIKFTPKFTIYSRNDTLFNHLNFPRRSKSDNSACV